MKQDWDMCIYKIDPRCIRKDWKGKVGRRLISNTTWYDRDSANIDREVKELIILMQPWASKREEYVFECTPIE